jgi:hypothetical protein
MLQCKNDAIGQEQTLGLEAIICCQVKILIMLLLCKGEKK